MTELVQIAEAAIRLREPRCSGGRNRVIGGPVAAMPANIDLYLQREQTDGTWSADLT